MRGFLHIIEIIIITLVMFVVLFQLSYVPGIPMNFDKAKLSLLGDDMLFSLDSKGVNWLDRQEVKSGLDYLLSGSNIVYNVEIMNAIKTPIYVGCICSEEEFAGLEAALTNFTLNNEEIEFFVTMLEEPTRQNCQNFYPTLPLMFDVILMYDYDFSGDLGCSPNRAYDLGKELDTYLGAGKGFVLVRDFSRGSFEKDGGVYEDFFGIEYNAEMTPQGGITFTEDNLFPKIKKYFHHIPLYFEDFEGWDSSKWSPEGSSWVVEEMSGEWVYKGKSANPPGFNELRVDYPENYTAQFDFVTYVGGGDGFWSFGYNGKDDFLAAGLTPNFGGMLMIGNASMFSGGYYDFTPFPLANPPYIVSVTRRGGFVKAVVRDSRGREAEVQYDFDKAGIPIPEGENGIVLFRNVDSIFDNVRVTVPEPVTFDNFLGNGERVNISEKAELGNVVLRDDGLWEVPALVANYASGGRVAWLSAGSSQEDSLVRALVVWASGDLYQMIQSPVRNPAVTKILKVVNIDMFQPMEIVLKLGFVF